MLRKTSPTLAAVRGLRILTGGFHRPAPSPLPLGETPTRVAHSRDSRRLRATGAAAPLRERGVEGGRPLLFGQRHEREPPGTNGPPDEIEESSVQARLTQQTNALPWLPFHCTSDGPHPAALHAAHRHLPMIADNTCADPRLRMTCARLAEQWAGRLRPPGSLH